MTKNGVKCIQQIKLWTKYSNNFFYCQQKFLEVTQVKNLTKKRPLKKRVHLCPINLICWIIIPCAVSGLLVLDGIGFYRFNTERLAVLGAGLLVLLIPFFSEITVKNISFKITYFNLFSIFLL